MHKTYYVARNRSRIQTMKKNSMVLQMSKVNILIIIASKSTK